MRRIGEKTIRAPVERNASRNRFINLSYGPYGLWLFDLVNNSITRAINPTNAAIMTIQRIIHSIIIFSRILQSSVMVIWVFLSPRVLRVISQPSLIYFLWRCGSVSIILQLWLVAGDSDHSFSSITVNQFVNAWRFYLRDYTGGFSVEDNSANSF